MYCEVNLQFIVKAFSLRKYFVSHRNLLEKYLDRVQQVLLYHQTNVCILC